MRKPFKRSKKELKFREDFYALKRMGQLKPGVRLPTHQQYVKLMNITDKHGKKTMTNSKLLQMWTWHNVGSVYEANRLNAKLAKKVGVRHTKKWSREHWAQAHQEIESRLSTGENKRDVLADYGY